MMRIVVACLLALSTRTVAFYVKPHYTGIRKTFLTATSTFQEQDRSSGAVNLVDEETDCEVILIGCLHGSPSSADDVRRFLSSTDIETKKETDVIVLELCETRYSDLQKEMSKEYSKDANGSSNERKEGGGGLVGFFSVIAKVIKKRGLAEGVTTAILGGMSNLQTSLSKFEPGLEFATAIEMSSTIKNCEIILADQTVDETLRRLSELPSESLIMITEFVSNKFDWDKTYGRESKALGTAVFGDNKIRPYQMNLGRFLTRNKAAAQDFARSILPPAILYQLLIVSSYSALGVSNSNNDISPSSFSFLERATTLSLFMDLSSNYAQSDMLTIMAHSSIEFLSSISMLFLGYILIALPATRLILCERDDYLVNGIRDACNLAATKNKSIWKRKGNGGRVVAVLGFLHVNGVAKQLLEQPKR